jgi:glycine/D-amino acid oxidase-like deaminating enzyme
MGISKNEHIAIIGGGAFGLSTAFELSQQGYTDITVFEKDAEIPSRWSAANDLNKIMRAEYEDPWYTELGVVSRSSCYHETDSVDVCSGSCKEMANTSLRALLPPSGLPKLRLWSRNTKSD